MSSGHPWIFASDVVDRGSATAGTAVRVLDPKGRLLGVAHYSSTSQICLRLLTRREASIDRWFFRSRIEQALEFRRRFVTGSDAYRLVFGEADLLPGLIVDRYADCLVMQTLNQGMDGALGEIVAALEEALAPRAIVLRNDVAVRERESLSQEKTVLKGEAAEPVRIHMNGFGFDADLLHGQKTGVYLDQRENYAAAAKYARGRALDCFTSSGGFAMHMARHCQHVTAVDSSELAISRARANAQLNSIANIHFREADVFDLLAAESHARQQYSMIVLDPPAFAKSRGALEGAVRGYREINLRALRLLEAGGILVTCSCSHHMTEPILLEAIAQAALDAGRTVRILERRTQAADHPILLTVPETLYLKCLILQVL